MKLGVLTASLGGMSAEEVIEGAAARGLAAVELAAWPDPPERPFTAAHVRLDDRSIEAVRHALDEHEVRVSALAYYDNPLDADASRRARVHTHLDGVIEAANALDCPLVGTFIGRDLTRNVAENLAEAERIFPRFVERAESLGVRLMIENCAMHGWHPDGYPGNLAYSPELWEWLQQLGLWLNFDPSHLPPLGIDPYVALEQASGRVVHVHAKDVAVSASARNRVSVYGEAFRHTGPWDASWWSYRLPGEGDLDWPRLIGLLDGAGYDGVISIEHEDEQGPGTQDSTLEGVERAAQFLDQAIERRDHAATTQ